MEGALSFLAGTNAETLDAKFAFWVFSLPKIQAPLTSLPTFFPECKDDTHTHNREVHDTPIFEDKISIRPKWPSPTVRSDHPTPLKTVSDACVVVCTQPHFD